MFYKLYFLFISIQYVLLFEISQQTQVSSEVSGLTTKNTQNCFEKILGVRRGHIRGIGRKPSTVVSMYDQEQPLTQPPQQSQVTRLFKFGNCLKCW